MLVKGPLEYSIAHGLTDVPKMVPQLQTTTLSAISSMELGHLL